MPIFLPRTQKIFFWQPRSLIVPARRVALILFCYCFRKPKFNYYLRCCPFWKLEILLMLTTEQLKLLLGKFVKTWSLPISYGGLGVRSVFGRVVAGLTGLS